MLQGLAGALQGRGTQLNQTIRGVNDTFVPATAVVDTLYHDRGQVSRLINDLGSLSTAIGKRSASIAQLANAGLTAFNAVAARDNDLRSLLRELPPTLAQVRTTSNTLAATSNQAAPVVENLAGAVHDLRPAIQYLRPAARAGQSLLNELALAAPPLSRTVDRLRAASGPVAKALPPVRAVLCQADPMLVYIKPYIKDFIRFMVGFGSSANSYDALGHLLRVTLLLNRHDLVGAPPAVDAAVQTLLKSGLVSMLTGATNYDPIPKPNMVGKNTSNGTAHIQTMDELAKSGFKYPHVVADCNPAG
jgi:ABC-type transporter Mla subunit MlaD